MSGMLYGISFQSNDDIHGWLSPGSLQHSSHALVFESLGPGKHWHDSRPYARHIEPVHSCTRKFSYNIMNVFKEYLWIPLTPMKQTNSSLHFVLFGLLTDGGHCGPRPLQKLASLQPLSSRHLSPNFSWHAFVQQGPWNSTRYKFSWTSSDHNIITIIFI